MAKTNIPRVVQRVSAEQLVIDAKAAAGGNRRLVTPNLGRSVTFNADGIRNPPDQFALRADISELGGNPLDGANWIITVRPGVLSEQSGINSPFWMATVNFGAGAISSQIRATANPGFCMSLPASYIELTLGINPDHGSSILVAGKYDFNVTAHRGMPSGDGQIRLRVQTNGVSGLMPVPAFAKYFMPVSTNCYGAGVTAGFIGGFTYSAAEFTAIKANGGIPDVPTGDDTIFWQPEADVYVFDWILEL